MIQTLFLLLPAAGLMFTAARVGRRLGAGALRWSDGHPGRRATLACGTAALVALAAFSWWPNGEYRPIQPRERGTIEGLLGQIRALPTGRPSLTARRQRQLGGAPTERQRAAAAHQTTGAARSNPGSTPAVGSGRVTPTVTTAPATTVTTPPSATTTSTTPATSTTSPSSTATTTTTGTTPTTTTTTTGATGTTPASGTSTQPAADTTTTPTTTTTTTTP